MGEMDDMMMIQRKETTIFLARVYLFWIPMHLPLAGIEGYCRSYYGSRKIYTRDTLSVIGHGDDHQDSTPISEFGYPYIGPLLVYSPS